MMNGIKEIVVNKKDITKPWREINALGTFIELFEYTRKSNLQKFKDC